MSDLLLVADPANGEQAGLVRGTLPVPNNDGILTRRDLDMIKRDLITVRKDYHEIRDNMVILTHQYSSAPSRGFFVVFALVWLILMAGLLTFQPQLAHVGEEVTARVLHHTAPAPAPEPVPAPDSQQ